MIKSADKNVSATISNEATIRRQSPEEWKRENREAIEWSNEYVRKNGLPLEKYRMF